MNPKKLMKQMNAMQEQMQRQLADTVIEATAGGGMVTVKMNGHKEVLDLKLDPEAVDPEDVEMLQDLIMSALGEAHRRADEAMQGALGGMLPPGMAGLF
ncbi:MAG: YbaB/EbfC family nucleoid-associated protein [Acidobacteriota bacterium]